MKSFIRNILVKPMIYRSARIRSGVHSSFTNRPRHYSVTYTSDLKVAVTFRLFGKWICGPKSCKSNNSFLKVINRFRPAGLRTYTSQGMEKKEQQLKSFLDVAGINKDIAIPYHKQASVYVHWPYCQKRCTYCNFNKYISPSVNEQRMQTCLEAEIRFLLNLSGISHITSVFFGGGTPSLAAPTTIAAVLGAIQGSATLSDQAEVTLEVNPTSLEMENLRAFKSAGVNRISIGIQALDPADLQVLGRVHSVADSLKCVDLGRTFFGENVSVDLIFGRPDQTLESWMEELKRVLEICGSHISLYQLTLERGTELFKLVKAGRVKLPNPDTVAAMYIEAVKILEDYSFDRYEVSNFAKERYFSYHNLSYWRGLQYIGVGPGAHGRFGIRGPERQARVQTLEPSNWMYEVEKFGHGTRWATVLSQQARLEELLYLGLRTKWGISQEMWQQVSPFTSIEARLASSSAVQSLVQRQLLQLDSRGMRATAAGLNILDSMFVDLLTDLQMEGIPETG